MQERFQSMMERVRTLEIAHQDPELVIGYADGSNRTFFTDGREIADDLESGTFGVESRWKKGSQIVVESKNAMGGKVSEVYRLGDTDETLEVSTTVEGGGRRPEMSFKRVYERTLAVAAVEGAKATDDLIDSGSSADDQ